MSNLCAALSIILVTIFATTSETGDIIRRYDFKNDGLGNYSFDVETGNEEGVLTSFRHKQQGHLENQDQNNESVRVDGQILYKVDDSFSIVVNYTADERGYRPRVRWILQSKQAKNDSLVGLRGPGGPGGPTAKTEISSHALGSLIGGNG